MSDKDMPKARPSSPCEAPIAPPIIALPLSASRLPSSSQRSDGDDDRSASHRRTRHDRVVRNLPIRGSP